MRKKIVLSDGVVLEVLVSDEEATEISFRENLNKTFDDIVGSIEQKMVVMSQVLPRIKADQNISTAKITFGFAFSAEGNLILTKSNLESSVKIELTCK